VKTTLQCPKCDGRKIAHVPHVDNAMNGQLALAHRAMRFVKPPVGHVEAFVCAGCGYSEHYTTDVDALLEGDGVRLIDNEPKATLR